MPTLLRAAAASGKPLFIIRGTASLIMLAGLCAAATARAQESDTPKLIRVTKDYPVFVDLEGKQVIVEGHVCLREGQLEMFACPKHTKEHESIVSVHAPAKFVHAALLAVGAKSGKPASYDPIYRPASGTEVAIEIVYTAADGIEHRVRAQDWIKHARSGKKLSYEWVFAGSVFLNDEATGEQYYYADGGELICVSNFPTAMLDLPIESSAANDDLLYVANTALIPPLETPVRLILTPRKSSVPNWRTIELPPAPEASGNKSQVEKKQTGR